MLSFFHRLHDVFGLQFILYLVVSQLLLKGMCMRLSMGMMLPLLKSMGVDATQFQIYMSVAMVPWTFKPVVGLCSDLLTLKQYKKKWWIVLALASGLVGAGLLFGAYTVRSVPWLVACFVLLQFAISVTDLLTEGKYSELMRDNPKSGSDIITFVNGLQTGGSIVAMTFMGPMADKALWYPILGILFVLMAGPLVPTLLGWLPEKKIEMHGAWINIDKERWQNDKQRFMVVGLAGLAGPLVAIAASLVHTAWLPLVMAFAMLCVILVLTRKTFPRVVFMVATYQVIAFVSKPSMGGALDYFYTADEQCVLSGPHFDWAYYLTYTGLVGAMVGFAAVWLYQLWLSTWKFRNVLTITTILVGCGGIMDLMIVLRLNRNWFHIPDKWFYLFGEAVLETVVSMLYWIPSLAEMAP